MDINISTNNFTLIDSLFVSFVSILTIACDSGGGIDD